MLYHQGNLCKMQNFSYTVYCGLWKKAELIVYLNHLVIVNKSSNLEHGVTCYILMLVYYLGYSNVGCNKEILLYNGV